MFPSLMGIRCMQYGIAWFGTANVWQQFRNDFFPGETVSVLLEDGEHLEGVIREKARFPEIRNPDGSIKRAAFSRYFVRINDQQGDEALLDDKHIKRGRRVFTKQNLRSFLKNSIQREAWAGAPWLVKEHLAVQYRLPMEIPAHLTQAARAASQETKVRHSRQMLQQDSHRQDPDPYPYQQQSHQPQAAQGQKHFNTKNGRKGKNLTLQDFQLGQAGQPLQYGESASNLASYHPPGKMEPPKPPPVPIKYPIEDLDISPKRNGITRPKLNFLTSPNGEDVTPGELRMESVGLLLEVWNTLNVQCEIFLLDSFTLDDFIDAMKFSSDEITCELLDEMHCAVLKQIVNEEGQLQVSLPEMIEDESDEEDEIEESEPTTPVLDAPAHATRSRLSQIGSEVKAEQRDSATPSETKQKPHRAQEMLSEYGWVERLQARDFANGGWQTIMVGLLYQMSLNPRRKQACDKILAELAPLDEEPTQETARQRYVTLDVNLRISALQIITMLAISTKALRNFLEQCSEDMTEVRKVKLDHQREKKACHEQLHQLELQRKMMLPDNMPESPEPENADPMDITNGDIDATMEPNGTASSDAEDEEPTSRSLRRGADRKRKRDEDAAKKEKERQEKAEAAKASSKQSKEFKKVCKDIDVLMDKIRVCEEKIAECDRDLREANVQRTRVLGRDRFWNRYYWFERNGMPFEGIPASSTAEYGYANARIWVQGPDEMERTGFIDLPKEDMDQYYAMHRLTVPERKTLEEGVTSVSNADQWGYYDDPDAIDSLIGWLDERGKREKDLRKELQAWRDPIVQQMEKLQAHLKAETAKKEEADEEPVTRVSTRHKTYIDTETAGQRCLRWRNSFAVDKLGHLHSEQPKPKKKAADRSSAKGVAKVILGKGGKPVTRQGTTRSGK